jgi:hypothetical protein
MSQEAQLAVQSTTPSQLEASRTCLAGALDGAAATPVLSARREALLR